MISCFSRMRGMARSWMGVGSTYPIAFTPSSIALDRPNLLNAIDLTCPNSRKTSKTATQPGLAKVRPAFERHFLMTRVGVELQQEAFPALLLRHRFLWKSASHP